MAFKDFPEQAQGVQLLQRSLARRRLAHAYLFTGHQLDELEALARTLAQTLNCRNPVRAEGAGIDSCDVCPTCHKIQNETHADVHWVRPESKSRVIVVDQMRELMREIQLKPTEADYKVAVIVAADRLKTEAANAFLKTLEEPPPKSVLILLSTEPQRILETIVSRCLRLNFGGDGARPLPAARLEWLAKFADAAGGSRASLIGRYRLLGVLAGKLAELKAEVEATLKARSPLERYDDIEPALREKWEEELTAAVEAEYRRRRAELLADVQMWFRDIWLQSHSLGQTLLNFPQLNSTQEVARRINPRQATENLRVLERTQRLLGTNVQEALALEVGLLKLNL